MKKKLAAIVLCIVMVISMSMTGCGSSTGSDSSDSSSDSDSSDSTGSSGEVESLDDLSAEDQERCEFVYIGEDGSESDFETLAGSTQEATLGWDWSYDDDGEDYLGYSFEIDCSGKECTLEISGSDVEELDEIYTVENGSLADLEEGDTVNITFDSAYYLYEEDEEAGSVSAYLLIDSITIN